MTITLPIDLRTSLFDLASVLPLAVSCSIEVVLISGPVARGGGPSDIFQGTDRSLTPAPSLEGSELGFPLLRGGTESIGAPTK